MDELKQLLKLDKSGLWYIDSNDVKLSDCSFPEVGKSYSERRRFYKIDGIDDYIIKDSTRIPPFFNETVNKRLLRNLISKQEELPDIGFPVAYYCDNNIMKGTIIPFYNEASSLNRVVYFNEFNELKEFYDHENNEIDNLICLFLDILDKVERMYEKGVIYTDIRTGNFVFYNNDLKIIDFDPGFVLFKDKKEEYKRKIIINYEILVDLICRHFGFKNVSVKCGRSFKEAEEEVKVLRKSLRG